MCYAPPPSASRRTNAFSPHPMPNWILKITFAGFVVAMIAAYVWKPFSTATSGVTMTNDFVLTTADGALDTKQLRGKMLMVMFSYAGCPEECNARLQKAVAPYELLSAAEKQQVKMILITVDPERDTPERIRDFARKYHPELVGATGKTEEIDQVAGGFGARYTRIPIAQDYVIQHSPLTYIVTPEGRFVSVMDVTTPPEKAVVTLRNRLASAAPDPLKR